jgi:hypothetical protein
MPRIWSLRFDVPGPEKHWRKVSCFTCVTGRARYPPDDLSYTAEAAPQIAMKSMKGQLLFPLDIQASIHVVNDLDLLVHVEFLETPVKLEELSGSLTVEEYNTSNPRSRIKRKRPCQRKELSKRICLSNMER